jgi:dienelactone hydrolase
VDPRAYAPAAQDIASGGVTVVIIPMPLNMAIFGINRAEAVFDTFPAIQTWAIGGHSLGGAMAAEFAQSHRDQISGLVLWAAYPGEGNDLSQSELAVLSISASEDGLATPDKINASRELLPESTQFVEIQGGNHAGFGRYGAQAGDGVAALSPAEQQTEIVNTTLDFLTSLTTNGNTP